MGCNDGSCSGCGVCRETILAQIRMVGLAHCVLFTNADEVAEWISGVIPDRGVLLSFGLALGDWMAESGQKGDITVPEEVARKILDRCT